ncbi:MAG: tetratricopeptide repeat protein [Candidatus Heimdallarchaeum aukensis]|uniref:Tetratricopeptide repeat protein n=1 Tax=Candidatus Heimdallarchaeum aukensis TaxID=2876573 RepID=A0A9Y1BKZ6_9ARCH|nr:MAG: tetratricopeptide repeat protein [Candidatus Heimdallarchaeum aukensis]
MQLIYEEMLKRLDEESRELVVNEVKKQSSPNPNEKLQRGSFSALKILLEKEKTIPSNNQQIVTLATLTCYLTQKMRATEELIKTLEKVDDPFVSLFSLYFQENPQNYSKIVREIDAQEKEIRKKKKITNEIQAAIYNIQSWVHGQQGEIDKIKPILKIVKERITKSEEIIEHHHLHEAFHNIIWWLLHAGVDINYEKEFSFISPYIERYGSYKSKTTFLNVKGSIYSYFGKTKEAIECFEKLIEIHSQFNDNYRLSIATGNLAEVLAVEGKIKKAKDMMEKAINLYKKSTGKWPYLYLTEIGNLYFLLGDNRAEESFLAAYEIQKNEKSMHKAFILFELVHYYLRVEKIAEAKRYLKELKSLARELEVPSINIRVDYLRGFLEMLQHNLTSAISFLHSALENASLINDTELILYSNIQLAVAYLIYYRLLETQENLNLALNYCETVKQLAVEYKHNQLLAVSYLVNAVLVAIDGDTETAFNLLLEARKIGEEIELDALKKDIDEVEKNIRLSEKTGTLQIKKQNVIDYILPQFKSLLSLKVESSKNHETEILGVLVISESGVPVYSNLKEKLKANDILLSGLLMAINQLAESITGDKEIRRLKDVFYEDFTISLQAIKNGIIAVIASEMSSEIRIWTLSLAERIKEIPRAPVKPQFYEKNIKEILEYTGFNK